ncbi:hypothetical protein [Rhodopirellula halodulae]|uniref:hypothetical protein n=1 Tax=Rhodopirellula halodulae TaxID=2894198 RepID=UPI001E2DFAE9|nr:hypothetical protein [Rhodopirellula sp. JC737]MCC9656270.1 hypothetical protein [Rhodopirellula sp. JC737]
MSRRKVLATKTCWQQNPLMHFLAMNSSSVSQLRKWSVLFWFADPMRRMDSAHCMFDNG